ncbi:SufE family protein [Pseudidiomarina sp. CB1]|uniref:SufE family protein n=1 Tax=Pseudidiomarina sp. CB1 TaxID=2972484 RepID=UPI002163C6CC|nr:SufE family protein [Pseudidiomarina sp. CB1]
MYGKLSESDLAQLTAQAQQQPQRLKFLIQQAALLPAMSAQLRTPENEVHGCEAQVWLVAEWRDSHLELQLDSASRVVKGLLALIYQALQHATAEQVRTFELDAFLQKLSLDDIVSVSRRNGLRAVVAAIQS